MILKLSFEGASSQRMYRVGLTEHEVKKGHVNMSLKRELTHHEAGVLVERGNRLRDAEVAGSGGKARVSGEIR